MNTFHSFLRRHQLPSLVPILFQTTAFCVGLLYLRNWYTRSAPYNFMLWNMVLAWMPLLLLLVRRAYYQRRWVSYLGFGLWGGLWLLFFPNALYLVTDLLHLRSGDPEMLWFDLIMFPAYAWTGFFLGFVSLRWMQEWIAALFNQTLSWWFTFAALGLSAFGIYLGRFLRWNSWDVFHDTYKLFDNIWQLLRHPLANAQVVIFVALMAGFLFCAYYMLLGFTRLREEPLEVK